MESLNNANVIQEEPKKVCFNYDLFLNLEGNPPVNHLRCEKLTFNNPTRDFRRKLVKAGGVSAALWEMELFVACLSQDIFFNFGECALIFRSLLYQIMVVPEGAEVVPRPSPDYPMLPTIPLSAFSDPKKSKTSQGSKVWTIILKCAIWHAERCAVVFLF